MIDSRQVIIDTTIPNLRGYVEIREHLNGSFSVWYPDEGFCPCSPVCHEKHSHSYKQGYIQSAYTPVDRADADDWAFKMAEGREVKHVKLSREKKATPKAIAKADDE